MYFNNPHSGLFSRIFQKKNPPDITQTKQNETTIYPSPSYHLPTVKTRVQNTNSKPKILLDSYKKKKVLTKLNLLSKLIEERLSDDIDVNDLALKMGMSYTAFYRFVKNVTLKTPSVFIRTFRLKKALYLLENSTLNISEIAYEVGFKDPNYFSRVFKEEFGETPSGMRI